MVCYKMDMAKTISPELPELAPYRARDALEAWADFRSRTLFLVGEVDHEAARKLLVALHIMDEMPGDIRLIMNSVGGLEVDGYAIYDALRLAHNRIVIKAYGACQSIAAVILQAGDCRLISPEAQFMIHHGFMKMDGETDQNMIVAAAKRIEQENLRYHRILAERSGQPIEQIRKWCLAETFFDAKEAVRLGFADAVIRRRKRK
jgi:ATP-dependent Clp endopeptidase proteolytic subunit ClpP